MLPFSTFQRIACVLFLFFKEVMQPFKYQKTHCLSKLDNVINGNNEELTTVEAQTVT